MGCFLASGRDPAKLNSTFPPSRDVQRQLSKNTIIIWYFNRLFRSFVLVPIMICDPPYAGPVWGKAVEQRPIETRNCQYAAGERHNQIKRIGSMPQLDFHFVSQQRELQRGRGRGPKRRFTNVLISIIFYQLSREQKYVTLSALPGDPARLTW